MRWEYKYHVVIILKKREKRIIGVLRQNLGGKLRGLAKHKEAQIVEGFLTGDHVHICISIPPKHVATTNVEDCIKGKSAIAIVRPFRSESRISRVRYLGLVDTSFQQ